MKGAPIFVFHNLVTDVGGTLLHEKPATHLADTFQILHWSRYKPVFVFQSPVDLLGDMYLSCLAV